MLSCAPWSHLELALDSKVLFNILFWFLLLLAEAALMQQLVALVAAPLLQAQALNFLSCGVQEKYFGHRAVDHFELRVVILGYVVVDKPFHFRIGIQSSSAAALHASVSDHSVRGFLRVSFLA